VRATTVRLPDDVFAALEAEAERVGASTSELVREGVVLRLAYGAVVSAHEAGQDVSALLVETLRALRRE
jgi:ribbon-helix-helix CopG family protein